MQINAQDRGEAAARQLEVVWPLARKVAGVHGDKEPRMRELPEALEAFEADGDAAAFIARVQALTDGFQAPPWACRTYRRLLDELRGLAETLSDAPAEGLSADSVRDALREVIDPEVGINIVDLGLVYDVVIDGAGVQVLMTMTTPACPLGPYLLEEATTSVQRAYPGAEVDVQITWSPAWDASRVTDEGRRQLGWS